MTDKVQKIREEVEKRYEYWREKEFNSHSIESEIRMSECQHLLLMLDSLQEEPVSEEFEKEFEEVFKQYCKEAPVRFSYDMYKIKDIARHFANWQKEQFEKNRLKHCDALTEEQAQIESGFVTQHLEKNNRTPTFIDAIEYGMRLQSEQMMKDATEAYIRRNKCTKKNVLNGFDVTCDAIQKFNGGDKVKVIIIKEEKL